MEYVVGFYFSGDKVLLIQKQRPEWQRGKFNGIGGKIEPQLNETPLGAMTREFREETGKIVTDWTQFTILEGKEFSVYFFYAFGDFEGVDYWYTDETIYPIRLDSLQVRRDTVPNLKWLIPMALNHSAKADFANFIIYEQ